MAQPNTWPPIGWLWEQHRVNGAWYSGDPGRLSRDTSGFWRTSENNKTHVPIAADLASLSAGLVFAGSPTITHENATVNERLQLILEQTGLYQKLLQAAELQSAFGGVFLKLNWDKSLAPYPIVSVLSGDAGIPEYKHGVLISCTFWSVARTEDTGVIYRLEERYTADGKIESTLYKGDANNLGSSVSLDSIPETEGARPIASSGTNKLLATYIPNRLPNRQAPFERYGISDYDGLYTLFSALDEAYSSLMRDIRLGKTRIIVPMEFLRRKDVIIGQMESSGGKGAFTFNDTDEAFVALDINPQDRGAGITTVQSDIRAESHMRAIEDITRKIYMMAGYSPQSAGMDVEGQAESGTALNIRERRSMQTTESKKTYWWHSLIDFAEAMIALDAKVFGGTTAEGKLTVEFADNTQPDMQAIADTALKLNQAGAASTMTKVQLVHPDWDEEQVLEEVARINRGDPEAWKRLLEGVGAGAWGVERLRMHELQEEEGAALAGLPELMEPVDVDGE